MTEFRLGKSSWRNSVREKMHKRWCLRQNGDGGAACDGGGGIAKCSLASSLNSPNAWSMNINTFAMDVE